MLDYYNNIHFNCHNMIPAPTEFKNFFVDCGFDEEGDLQTICDLTIYPVSVLASCNGVTGQIEYSDVSYAAHHYASSWVDGKRAIAKKERDALWDICSALQKYGSVDV